MTDAVLVTQQLLQMPAHGMAVAARLDQHTAERAGSPEVMVHTCRSWISPHLRLLDELVTHSVGVEADRRGLQEDPQASRTSP